VFSVPDKELSWKYAEDLVAEPEPPSMGAQLAVLAAGVRAAQIIEIGTGAGVSGLWMLRGAPDATLTSIDTEVDHQQLARAAFADAGVPAGRIRLIPGRASEVLPRMNEDSYDLVLVDADAASVIEYVEHGLRLARTGGTVLVPHALWRGRVADPAKRDRATTDFRTLLTEVSTSGAVRSALSPAGDGLLQLTKLTA
jgi:predicted O-methyltransferase YrrM